MPINDQLVDICILFIFFAVVSWLINLIYIKTSTNLIAQITVESKQKVFNKIIDADYQFFIDHKQGDIIYKTQRAPAFIADVLTNLTKFSIDLMLSVSTFIILISISLKGTIILIIGGIVYYILTRYLSLKISYLTGQARYLLGQKESVILNESITGSKQIKVFEVTNVWKNQFHTTLKQFFDFWKRDTFWTQIPASTLYLLIFITIGSVIIYIKLFYPQDFIVFLPLLGTFSLAVLKLLPRVANFGNYQMGIMSALPNLSAVKKILDDTDYTTIKNGSLKFDHINPSIRFDNIYFSHKNRDTIFRGVSLIIEPGKTTAIVGPSGSGKSTLIDLVLRLYDVDQGAIFIDNTNIREYDLVSLREKIGFVSQDTFIFNSTIRDNISFGKNYPESKIIAAANLANAHEFILQLPQGYDTQVGDRGVKISGGERQRLAIARAIIRDPEILILDEATSSLDNVSEKIVQDAINNVAKKCTTIIVAHRLSTIKNADVIYVLENGRVIEEGSHDMLMDKKGKYWELYTRQVD
jgi:ABC-type multidrug transport system fused ATPase/permease subunit